MFRRGFVKSEYRGIVLILVSTVFFCLMSALVRYASGIDPYKTTLFRFVVGLGILGTAALFGKIRLRFVNGRLLFLRGLFGGVAILLCFWSIAKLGVGTHGAEFIEHERLAVEPGAHLPEQLRKRLSRLYG